MLNRKMVILSYCDPDINIGKSSQPILPCFPLSNPTHYKVEHPLKHGFVSLFENKDVAIGMQTYTSEVRLERDRS